MFDILQQCPIGTRPYRIKQGDTFYSIAQRFNTTIPALISANPMVDPENLQIGQIICIPLLPIYPPCPEGNYHIIRPGDTLYKISRLYNVSLDDLLEANPGINPNMLMVGQVICIPLATPIPRCPAGTMEYTVKAGDTFYSLARKYNTTIQELIRLNPRVNPMNLLIGQKICVPVREKTTT